MAYIKTAAAVSALGLLVALTLSTATTFAIGMY